MKHAARVFLYAVVCLFGAVTAWPIVELVIYNQEMIPSVLVYNLIIGGITGAFIGAFLGGIKGMQIKKASTMFRGSVFGLISGGIGGMLGMIVAQGILTLVGSYLYHSAKQLYSFGLPLSRTVGWGLLGIFVGITEGIRTRNGYRIRNGIIGGLLGGLCGGFLSELLRGGTSGTGFSRLGGLALLGAGIGLLYSLVDSQMSKGVLTALNGPAKGKTFPVYKKTIIGGSDNVDVTIAGGFPGTQEEAFATIVNEHGNYTIATTKGSATMVNDDPTKGSTLNDGDVVTVGTTRFLFQVK
ncbi:MAG: hypothetical protein JW874_04115 [Spirochaetales bacterium]|nr:hypothetical protein [Spirochaetales bacterium]